MGIALIPAARLQFDRRIENMFSKDDPLVIGFEKLKRTFEGNAVVPAVYRDAAIFSPDGSGMRRLQTLVAKLREVPGVRDVWSIDQPIGLEVISADDPVARRVRKLFEGYTHGSDGETVAVLVVLYPQEDAPVSWETSIAAVKDVMRSMPDGMVAGEPVMVAEGFRYVEQDGRRLGWATSILLGLVILIAFRRLRWVAAAIMVVQAASLWTKATLAILDVPISLVSSMLTAIVTVVGIATVVHVIVRTEAARRAGAGNAAALHSALRQLVVPVFWAIVTDAVGFLSLLVSAVGPVRDFGIMMSLAAGWVFVAFVLLVPGLAWLPWEKDGVGNGRITRSRLKRGRLRRVFRLGKAAAVASVPLGALAIVGLGRLEVETDFTRNFRSDTPLVRSYAYIEEHLGGAGVWDVVLPAPDYLSWPYLAQVLEFEDRLREEVVTADGEPGLTKVLSLADAVTAGAPVHPARVRSPLTRNSMVRAGLRMMENRMPGLYHALYQEDPDSPGRYCFRVMLRSRERQSAAAKSQIIRQVEAICREVDFSAIEDENGGASDERPLVTGYFVLLASLVESIVRDQWTAFAVATLGVWVVMLLALRHPLLAAAALVPNLLPIVFVLGWTGLLGLRINMGTAMIAAVSMGLSIDSSIHYLYWYRLRRKRRYWLRALAEAHRTVGPAMVVSTAALVLGFSVLLSSPFVPTIYFGALVGLTMIGGLLGNLFGLPLLLAGLHRWFPSV
ncbi:MMPL family transporter [Thermostilla marina]